MQERGDHGLESVVVAPPGVLVQHADKDWELLSTAADPHFDHATELGDGLSVPGQYPTLNTMPR